MSTRSPRFVPAEEGPLGPAPASLSDRVRSLRLPEDVRAGRRWSWKTLLLLAVLAGAGGAVYWQWPRIDAWRKALAAAPGPAAPPAASVTATSASPPRAAEGDLTLESKGYIIPAHQILVSPKVSGMIVRLTVEEGMQVQRGDVLAQIENTDYQADVDRAKAMLAAAEYRLAELERGNRPEEIAAVRAELAEAAAQRDQLYSAWKRNVGLRGSRVLTENEYEQSESQYKAMEQRVTRLSNNLRLMEEGPRRERIDVARAEVAQFKAELAKAEWRLDNCVIRAPISGTILKKNAEEGNIVNPIAFNGSFSVCEMADLSDLEVELTIMEREISRVHLGQPCEVRGAEAYPDRIYQGVVSRLMPIADRSKGAVPVRVKVHVPPEEQGVYLKPEMSALVLFRKSAGAAPGTAAAP